MKKQFKLFSVILLAALLITACGSKDVSQANQVTYSLTTGMQDGKMIFIGVGGSIDGVVNPTLKAKVGDVVTINLSSGEGAEHNFAMADFNVDSPHVVGKGKSITITFTVDKGGTFAYYCNLPGHRQAGMEGKFEVEGPAVASAPTMDMSASSSPNAASSAPASPATGADISRDPADLPGPIGDRGPTNIRIDLEAKEVIGQLADGTTFTYWTFNSKVPGPFFRVRVGDTVEVHLKNAPDST
ncbi:MAG: multicopper oxidase domain-containing protein, partial [Chloroflexi bacterium]|nr:multicopper oxidase domain-containing protein [Chloroflexota bacterium]